MKKSIFCLIFALTLVSSALGQTAPYALLPPLQACFSDASGAPYVGGKLYSYQAGTTTLQPTYVDAGSGFSNPDPITLDARGCKVIFLGPQSYKFVLQDSLGNQVFTVDNVSDVGQLLYTKAVLLSPAARAPQIVQGLLGADLFQQTTPHATSPGVRVGILDPLTILDTPTNPPYMVTVPPANPNQHYFIPDIFSQQGNFVINPGPLDWVLSMAFTVGQTIQPILNNPCNFQFTVNTAGTTGTIEPTFSTTPCGSSATSVSDSGVVWTSNGAVVPANALDCSLTGITCKRTAYSYFEAAGCNNATAALGWDTFGTNAPSPICITGANTQKGVMAFQGASSLVQQNTGSGASAGTCTTTYPADTVAGHLLEVEIAVDGAKTVSGVTDGTNAYSKAVNVTNGNYDLEIWYFDGSSTSKTAGTTLTVTLSANANCALAWKEYSGIATASALDKTASNTGTGTAVTTGTTASTSQATELILGAVATAAAPTIFLSTSGWSQHFISRAGTNASVDSQGKIQQAAATQATTFTLGTSQIWASAIATFKVSVAGPVQAQRSWGLPPFYLSTVPVNSTIKWTPSGMPVQGTVSAVWGAQLACSPDGSTDDPAFNTVSLIVNTIPTGGTSPVTTTALPNLSSTGCAAGSLMHYRIYRDRYNAADTYEGYMYAIGAGLQYGINQ